MFGVRLARRKEMVLRAPEKIRSTATAVPSKKTYGYRNDQDIRKVTDQGLKEYRKRGNRFGNSSSSLTATLCFRWYLGVKSILRTKEFAGFAAKLVRMLGKEQAEERKREKKSILRKSRTIPKGFVLNFPEEQSW